MYLHPLAVQRPSALVLLWELKEPWRFPAWWQCQDTIAPVPPCCPLTGTAYLLWIKQGQDQAAKSLRAQLQPGYLLLQLVARKQLI